MNDLVTQVGLLDEVDLVRLNRLEGASVGLFKTNHTPAITDVLGTYTAIESTFGGYARQTATGWTAAAMTGTTAYTTSPVLTFTPNAAPGVETAYGYFIFLGATLLGAGLFAGPVTIAASTPFSVVLQRTLHNG